MRILLAGASNFPSEGSDQRPDLGVSQLALGVFVKCPGRVGGPLKAFFISFTAKTFYFMNSFVRKGSNVLNFLKQNDPILT